MKGKKASDIKMQQDIKVTAKAKAYESRWKGGTRQGRDP